MAELPTHRHRWQEDVMILERRQGPVRQMGVMRVVRLEIQSHSNSKEKVLGGANDVLFLIISCSIYNSALNGDSLPSLAIVMKDLQKRR